MRTWMVVLALGVIVQSSALAGEPDDCGEFNTSPALGNRFGGQLAAAEVDAIVIGTIESKECKNSGLPMGGTIHTEVLLLVEQSLKGALVPGEQVRVVIPGGIATKEDGKEHMQGIIGFKLPSYDAGDQVLVYLKWLAALNAYNVVDYYGLQNGIVSDGFGNP